MKGMRRGTRERGEKMEGESRSTGKGERRGRGRVEAQGSGREEGGGE